MEEISGDSLTYEALSVFTGSAVKDLHRARSNVELTSAARLYRAASSD